jgi:DNA polymerase I-like protein with 3'-5' exonuclease and polymerase domains
MNIPKRGPLAKACRDMFVAAPGCRLAELDFKAIQAVIIGYLAKDEDFIRASKLGVHAILASHVLARQRLMTAPIDLTLDTSSIKTAIRAVKAQYPKLYDVCKHVVYLSSFGGTPYRMKVEYPDEFPSIKYAEELQQLYFSTLGRKVRQWQLDTLQLAHKQCYLDSPFGHRHYFWNVFAWDTKRRQMVWGPNAKDALAFLPQAIERCVLTSAIQRVVARDLASVLRWPIHDSLLVEVANGDTHIATIKEEMQRPIPELDNLSIEVEVSVGESWGSMTEWRP